MRILGGLFGGLISRLLAVALAVGAAQFPLYFLAYENALAGARAEAEIRYRQLEQEASQLQLGIEAFIQRHETNGDEAFRASGRIHRTTVERYQRFSAMQLALRESALWQRPLALAKNFDPALHTAAHFQPGVPLTPEGGIYALIGLLLAWLLSAVAGAAFRPRT